MPLRALKEAQDRLQRRLQRITALTHAAALERARAASLPSQPHNYPGG